ncbi:MAG TPA: amidohydrolase family protein [Trebonia sp.]
MRIDVHGHVSAPSALYRYQASLIAHRGAHARGGVKVSDEQIRSAMTEPIPSHGGISHLTHLDEAGIDIQLLSARPYTMMHSEQPGKIVRWFTEETNTLIRRVCEQFPDRFRGVAGLPQSPELGVDQWVAELQRCVTDFGFVGCLLNPDPYEGTAQPPDLGDRYWYPVYEALCELDVPALIHAGSCRPPARESYSLHFVQESTVAVASLVNSEVFTDFPGLKLVISHGGGAIPYQAGRLIAARAGDKTAGFLHDLRQLYFDTCLYTQEAVELLLRTVGPDRCLFGSEKPGTGSHRNPETGRWFDDVHALIEGVPWLSEADRTLIFEENAAQLYGIKAGR